MKMQLVLGLMVVIAHGLSFGISTVQAECTVVYFSLYDPGQDPPCGLSPDEDWWIRVTTSPSPISAGTCSSFDLDNLYPEVELFEGD